MKASSFASTVLVAAAAAASGDELQQCNGIPPQADMINFLGASLDYDVADHICCHNHRYAEPSGYLEQPQVALFDRLDPTKEHIFYDVVCGLPLFIAPRGRSFDEFREESIHHGWPSFRPEEMISENVILHENGRMESKCLTHLGHNLPKDGVDRYCIDLVCIAGSPLDAAESNLIQQFPSLLLPFAAASEEEEEVTMDKTTAAEATGEATMDKTTAAEATEEATMDKTTAAEATEEATMDKTTAAENTGPSSNFLTADRFRAETYVSSADQNSGKVSQTGRNVTIGVVVAVSSMLVSGIVAYFWIRRNNKCANESGPLPEPNV